MIHVDINLKVDHLLTQVTVHARPPSQPFFQLKQPSFSTVPSRKALKLPEVVEAIRAECEAMPPACNQWTVDVHDQLLSKYFRQAFARYATAVPGLPRKPWVTAEVSKCLLAHAAARRMFRSSLRSLQLSRLRVQFVAWAVCPRSRPRALRPFPRRRCPPLYSWPAAAPHYPSPCDSRCVAGQDAVVAGVCLADQIAATYCSLGKGPV